MKIIFKILTITLLLFPVIVGACKKQAKCGCDGDIINSFAGVPVTVVYDSVNKSAQFRLVGDYYSRYYFCNPTDMMDKLVTFENGAEVLIDCDIYWECNYMYQASNSYYGSMYRVYMADVSDIRENLYGK